MPPLTPYTPLDETIVAGQIDHINDHEKIAVALNALMTALGAAWTTYTPTWVSSGVQPVIGNGIMAGAYLQLGKTLFVRVVLIPGTTTTFGTGTYSFSLPPGCVSAAEQALAARLWDTSTGTAYEGAAGAGAASALLNVVVGSAFVTPTSPFTLANGDNISITGVMEIV